jgi:HSP20 family protein
MVESSHKSGLIPSLMDPLRSMSARVADWFAPASEAAVNGSEYRIALELPGVAEEDIDITVHDGVVSVGREDLGTGGEGRDLFLLRTHLRVVLAVLPLPPDADAEAVNAGLKDGLLTIRVPKKADTSPEGARKVKIARG